MHKSQQFYWNQFISDHSFTVGKAGVIVIWLFGVDENIVSSIIFLKYMFWRLVKPCFSRKYDLFWILKFELVIGDKNVCIKWSSGQFENCKLCNFNAELKWANSLQRRNSSSVYAFLSLNACVLSFTMQFLYFFQIASVSFFLEFFKPVSQNTCTSFHVQ